MKVACIGAGVAGLSAARCLVEGGAEVTLFDKGRGAGGRLSTRRAATPLGEVRFDHGAQFFTARSEAFAAVVNRLVREGAVKPWTPVLVRIDAGEAPLGVTPDLEDIGPRYVGAPGMNGLVKALASGLDVQWGKRVVGIEPSSSGSMLRFEDGESSGPFDTVISAVPAEQAAQLLAGTSQALADEAGSCVTAPCWAVMLCFARPVEAGWDAAAVENSPIGWTARDSSKPGRDAVEAWMVHATPEWTRENVDAGKEEVAAVLTNAFRDMTGAPAPEFSAAHRWLYARTEVPAGSAFGWDADRRIASIGDWRTAPRVEAAWESGRALADFLLD